MIPTRCPTCCEHGLATVSEPKRLQVEQVCLLQALWKPWQLQCTPHAPTRVLTPEESLELRVTSTVPINQRCLFELLANPEERFCCQGSPSLTCYVFSLLVPTTRVVHPLARTLFFVVVRIAGVPSPTLLTVLRPVHKVVLDLQLTPAERLSLHRL